MSHIHNVIDDDRHFLIDPNTRTITRTAEADPVLIQCDHNSERFTFNIPKEIDGHDMTLCNRVQVHFININKDDPNDFKASVCEINPSDLTPLSDDDDMLAFTWLIDQMGTSLIGPLNFAVRFMCTSQNVGADGEMETVLDYAWNTKPYIGVNVSEGMDNTELISGAYYDVVDQWYATITNAGEAAKAEAITEINETRGIVLAEISNTRTDAVKLVQDTEAAALDNIADHAETVMGNFDTTKIGSEILSRLAIMEEDIAALSGNGTLVPCNIGELSGGTDSGLMTEYGDENSFFLAGGSDYLISHATTTPLRSLTIVVPIKIYWSPNIERQHSKFIYPAADIFFRSEEPVDNTYVYGFEFSDGSGYTKKGYLDIPASTPPYHFGQAHRTAYVNAELDSAETIISFPDGIPIRFVLGGTVYEGTLYPESVTAPWVEEYETPLEWSHETYGSIIYAIIPAKAPNDTNLKICSFNFDSSAGAFTVNPNGIAAIAGPVEENLEDKYTIVLDNGDTKEFKIPNGNSAGIRTSDSGGIVNCKDVIDVEHTVKTKVRSKNLADLTKASAIAATITSASDGSITLAPATEIYGIRFRQSDVGCFEVGKTYTASIGSVTDHTVNSWGWRLSYSDGTYEDITANKSEVYTFTPSKEVGALQFYVGSPYLGNKEIVITDIQIEECDTVTDYIPYVDVSAVKLTRCGKNLIPYPYAYGTGSVAGITYTVNSDGTVIATGTATDNSIHYMTISPKLHLPAGTYTLSGCPAGGSQSTYRLNIKRPDEKYHYDTGEGCTFTLTEDDDVQIYIFIGNGYTASNLKFKPQLEAADKASDFESYKATTYTIGSDGAPTERVRSIAPTMNLFTDKAGTIIDATYNVDQTAAYNRISGLLETLLNGGE